MSGGAFSKENRNKPKTDKSVQLTAEERAKLRVKRLRKQKQRQRLLFAFGVMAVLLILVVIVLICLPKSPLVGKWDMDSVTTYEFGRNGKGAMVLPNAEYAFSYTARDGVLQIDFHFEGAKDAEYQFRLEGDTLTLEGGNLTVQGTYVLHKIEDSDE